jgi:tRNA nucleotidyltransferase (CCA-adding enzyme)
VSEARPVGAAVGAGADAAKVLQALALQPGGCQLLALGLERADLALVGGAVRDLLLGATPRELDVVVAAGAASFAGELSASLAAAGVRRPAATVHERFGTAVVEWDAGRVDIAERRAESYSAPGALPDVRPGTVAEDLRRRDFTVNAIAVALGRARGGGGGLDGVEHALEDLAGGRLRVLHEQSFVEDPTRLLRLARYRARLGFEVEARTAELAAQALGAGALATVSRARIGAELRLALGEADAVAALAATDELGVLAALDPRLRFDGALARAALEMLASANAAQQHSPRRDLLLLAVLLAALAAGQREDVERDMYRLLDELEFPAGDRDLALHAAIGAEALAGELAGARAPSEVYEAASCASLEGVALAGAWGELRSERGEAGAAARQWLAKLCDVSLLISGEDLLALGIHEGPEIGRRLRAALLRKLDGELDRAGRAGELSAALEAQV